MCEARRDGLAEESIRIVALPCRFIDTAYDLEKEGVSDPAGSSHLAELLGHLFDMKVVS